MENVSSFSRYMLRGVVFVLIYQVLVVLSRELFLLTGTNDPLVGVQLFFLAPAASIVFILFFGPRYIPFLIINPIYNTIANDRPLFLVIGLTIILPLTYGSAGILLRSILKDRLKVYSLRDIVKFTTVCLIAPMISSAMIQLVFIYNGRATFDQFIPRFLDWYVGDLIGIFTLAPFLLATLHIFDEHSLRQLLSYKTLMNSIKPVVILIDNVLIFLVIFILSNYSLNLLYLILFPIIFIAINYDSNYTIFMTTYNSLVTAFLLATFGFEVNIVEFEALMVTLIVTALFLSAAAEDRKRSEDLLKNKEKQELENAKYITIGKLSQGIVHDLNNVLTSLNGQISVMELDYEIDDRDLDGIKQSLQMINNLAVQFRTLSKFRSPALEEVSINEVLLNIKSTLDGIVDDKIQLQYNLTSNNPMITVNPNHMEQIILNLVVNAYEAIEEGGNITVETQAQDDDLYIRVIDTGSGIDEENLDHLFDILFTTKTNHSGLGLWIVQEIVNQNHGTLSVSSELGQGTTFEIQFPLNQ